MTIRELAEMIVRFHLIDKNPDPMNFFFRQAIDEREKELRKRYLSDGKNLFVGVQVEDTIHEV